MPNQIHLTPTATVIMLPQGATDVCKAKMFGHPAIHFTHGDDLSDYIGVPFDDYTIHQNAFDVSDDVCRKVVGTTIYKERRYSADGKKCLEINGMYDTYSQAYHSLLKSKGVYAVNPIELESGRDLEYSTHDTSAESIAYHEDWHKRKALYLEAQKGVGRWVLIIKKLKTMNKEDKIIGDLKKVFIAPAANRQQHIKFSPNQASGGVALAYYRGRAAEREDILKVLKKKYPEAYKYLNQ